MKLTIKNSAGADLYSEEATSVGELLYFAVKDSANLRGAYLHGANLRGTKLEGANLEGANLEGANLEGTNLYGANLRGANLEGANLEGTNLYGANLRGANLEGANLEGTNLYGANLRGANLEGAYLDEKTVIETGETWGDYLAHVVPALLVAGGRPLAEVLTAEHWDCHSWNNCPMAAAFNAENIEGVPILLRPRADQFIRYFDAKLIPLERVGKGGAA